MGRRDRKAKAPATESDHEEEEVAYSTDEYVEPGPAQTPNASDTKKDKAGRKRADRAKTRKLVRWNEVLDQRALLAVQHVCNQNGIKIPWAEVAAILGPTVSEGALVQHLAKLRARLESDGVPVTPPLKRGGKNASVKNKNVADKGATSKRTSSKLIKKDEDEKDNDYDSDGEAITKKKSKAQDKKKEVDSDSDGEPHSKRKRNASGKKKETDMDSDSEPLAKKKGNAHGKKKDTGSDSDSEPLAKKMRPNQPKKGSNAESKKDKTGSKEKTRSKGQSGSAKIKSEQEDDSGSKSSTKKADKARVEVKSEDADMDEYANDTDMDDDNEEVVAVGAPFLAQEWSGESVSPVPSNSTDIPSKVVALRIGQEHAGLIEAWQNNEEISGDNVHGHYVHSPASASAQLYSHHGQYANDPVRSGMMTFENDNEMLSNPGGFNNQTFGNNGDPSFGLGNLGFNNLSAAVKNGDGNGAQLDNFNVGEYGKFHNSFGFDNNGSGNQGGGLPGNGGYLYGSNQGGGLPGNGGYQYGSGIHNNGDVSQTINPLDLHGPSNGGDFGQGFGQFGLNPGMGFSGSSFAPQSINTGFNNAGGYRSGVTASTPKTANHGNDRNSKGVLHNASHGGFGAASSSQAGRHDDRSAQKGFKQEKSAKQAEQSHAGNNSLAGMPVAPFDPTLPMYDLSGGVGFNDSNENGVSDWLEDQEFDFTNYLNDNPFEGIS